MKHRTMTIVPTGIRVSGNAWGETLPQIVFEQWDNGMMKKVARITMRPIDIMDLATRLWELRDKYEQTTKDMTNALKGPTA